ncbi:MAG: glycoside hydrolase family 25 protein [Flavobacteriaceae bacterium]|jgi:lysozyme|nr:glycoside hydrolase family 25 protein [Flavobacteriaceae bacterium]
MQKNRRKKKKTSFFVRNSRQFYYWLTGIVIVLALLFFFRTTLEMYYYVLKGRFQKADYSYSQLDAKRSKAEVAKIQFVLSEYYGNAFGIDLSRHQGEIKWDSLAEMTERIPISFAFVRATRGVLVQDPFFGTNWEKLKEKNILRGAYHYYDVNKNSTEQAHNFLRTVQLEKGDLPPVLDVEDIPSEQSLKLLKKGLLNWLKIVENAYQIKPIIYSNDAYFIHHIADLDLSSYPIWVANYNLIKEPLHERWTFWQFSEKGIVKGINRNFVDLNVFNGDISALRKMTVE